MNFFKRKINMMILIIRELFARLKNKIIVENTMDTLETMLNKKKAVARFGDGEFNALFGEDLKFQKHIPELSDRLKDILLDKENNDNCLICIPYAMVSLRGLTVKSQIFWVKYYAKYRSKIMKVLSDDIKYYDSQITRIYVNRSDKNKSVCYFDKWKQLWNNKTILLVEGSESRLGVGNSLFDNSKEVKRIICPSKDAFMKYQEIYNAIFSISNYDICLIALGPTATVLAYDLSKHGILAIDTGNMDMEYEWMLRKVNKQIAIEGKYTMEAQDGTEVGDCVDERYKNQIIKVIF